MIGFSKPKGLVGLDIGSSSIKLVELRKKGSDFELVSLGMESLGQDAVVDGAIMDSFTVATSIEKIFNDNKIKTANVATAISGHSVIVKKIVVNVASEEEVAGSISYEAPQYIPFDMADVYYDHQVLGPAQGGPGFDVMLVAAKKDRIDPARRASSGRRWILSGAWTNWRWAPTICFAAKGSCSTGQRSV